jgi:hypothetical protein
MSAVFAIISGLIISGLVCTAACALLMPTAQTHRVWAARWAQVRANRAARASARAQVRANRASTRAQTRSARAEAAWREVFRG